MVISVKSELDSRVFIYPLLRTIYNHGSIMLITANTSIKRLIDNDYEGEWRNISIIIAPEGNTDDVLEEHGIVETDFDFLILDNMADIEFDSLFVLLGKYHTEEFNDDILNIIEECEEKVTLVQYGKPPAQEKSKEKGSKAKGKDAPVSKIKRVQVNFPSYEEFEQVEGAKTFSKVDPKLIKEIYKRVHSYTGLTEPVFTREVGKKDEGSGYLALQHTLWEI